MDRPGHGDCVVSGHVGNFEDVVDHFESAIIQQSNQRDLEHSWLSFNLDNEMK